MFYYYRKLFPSGALQVLKQKGIEDKSTMATISVYMYYTPDLGEHTLDIELFMKQVLCCSKNITLKLIFVNFPT